MKFFEYFNLGNNPPQFYVVAILTSEENGQVRPKYVEFLISISNISETAKKFACKSEVNMYKSQLY
jgi:hypothetical protein